MSEQKVVIPEDCVFPRSMFDRIVGWKESWLRDGDQTRRLKLANQVVGVLPRILRHVRHIERKIGTQWQRIATLEAARDEAEGRYLACYNELIKVQAEITALKSTVASLLSIDDSKVAEYVVLDAEALKAAAGNRVAELEAQARRLEAPVSDAEQRLIDGAEKYDTGISLLWDREDVDNLIASRSTPPAQEQPE